MPGGRAAAAPRSSAVTGGTAQAPRPSEVHGCHGPAPARRLPCEQRLPSECPGKKLGNLSGAQRGHNLLEGALSSVLSLPCYGEWLTVTFIICAYLQPDSPCVFMTLLEQ